VPPRRHRRFALDRTNQRLHYIVASLHTSYPPHAHVLSISTFISLFIFCLPILTTFSLPHAAPNASDSETSMRRSVRAASGPGQLSLRSSLFALRRDGPVLTASFSSTEEGESDRTWVCLYSLLAPYLLSLHSPHSLYLPAAA
jgi:hypothetical protein